MIEELLSRRKTQYPSPCDSKQSLVATKLACMLLLNLQQRRHSGKSREGGGDALHGSFLAAPTRAGAHACKTQARSFSARSMAPIPGLWGEKLSSSMAQCLERSIISEEAAKAASGHHHLAAKAIWLWHKRAAATQSLKAARYQEAKKKKNISQAKQEKKERKRRKASAAEEERGMVNIKKKKGVSAIPLFSINSHIRKRSALAKEERSCCNA